MRNAPHVITSCLHRALANESLDCTPHHCSGRLPTPVPCRAVDSHVLAEFMRQVGGSVDRLDELLGVYDGISGNTPGAAQDRMHTIIENSVRFASQIKGGVHLPLTAVCKWMHYQHQDLEREREMDEEEDDYDLDDVRHRLAAHRAPLAMTPFQSASACWAPSRRHCLPRVVLGRGKLRHEVQCEVCTA